MVGNRLAGNTGGNGPATSARINDPLDLQCDTNGVMYIADTGNGAIRTVSTSGIITTLLTSSSLTTPQGILFVPTAPSYLLIADSTRLQIFKYVISSSSLPCWQWFEWFLLVSSIGIRGHLVSQTSAEARSFSHQGEL